MKTSSLSANDIARRAALEAYGADGRASAAHEPTQAHRSRKE